MIEIILFVLILNSIPTLLDINYNNKFYLESYNKIEHKLEDYKKAESDLNFSVLNNKRLDYKTEFKIEKSSNENLVSRYEVDNYINKKFIQTPHLANWTKLSKNLKHTSNCNFNSITESVFINCDETYIKRLDSNLTLASNGKIVIEELNAKNIQIYSFQDLEIINVNNLDNSIFFSQLGEIKSKISSCNNEESFFLSSKEQLLDCNANKDLEYLLNFRPISSQLY